MKKKTVLLVLGMSLILLAGGCNKKNDLGDKGAKNTPTPTAGGTDTSKTPDDKSSEGETATPKKAEITVVKKDYNVDDYIKLGNYKGIEYTPEKLEVTDKDVEKAITAELQNNKASLVEITDRAVVEGDTVNIDYEGLKDGKAFDGGTATGYDLTIGSGAFIPGFEDQIIGAKKGDKIDVNVTFPENYGSADLAGQPVVFKVTVNKIQKYDLTEDYVKNNTDFDTIDAYKENMKKDLVKYSEQKMKDSNINSIYTKIAEASEIKEMPQNVLDYYNDYYKVMITNYAAAYGMEFDAFLSASGYTQESFTEESNNYAENMAKQELIMGAIAKAEKIELSEDEYQKLIPEYVEKYGFADKDTLLENTPEVILKQDMLFAKVMDYILAEAVAK